MTTIQTNQSQQYISQSNKNGISLQTKKTEDSKKINKDFFIPPKNYNNNNYDYKELENKKIYIPQFPKGKNPHLSEGKLKKINQNYFEFSHLASTKKRVIRKSYIIIWNFLYYWNSYRL